jgi:CheY-like chemotaxis protein
MKDEIQILLINANAKERDIFSFALNNLRVSYTCRFAANTKEAIKLLGNVIPDYIFIDFYEPKLDRFVFLKKIRSLDCFKNTAVIAFTDAGTSKFDERALRSGASMCVNKTSIIFDLICALKNIFAKTSTAELPLA